MLNLMKYFQSRPSLPHLSEDIVFTPDISRLEDFYLQNVFIYNEFMRGCNRYREVMEGNVRKLSAAFTRQTDLVLCKKNLGDLSQAVALQVSEEHRFGNTTFLGDPAKILGHIYTMRPGQIMKLDTEMLNGVAFTRRRIRVDIPFSYTNGVSQTGRPPEETVSIPVWAYIGNLDYWSEQMDPARKRFSTVKMYSKENEPYYFYAQRVEAHRS